MTTRHGFPTPEMVQLDRELDGRIDHALGRARELQATLDRLEAKDDDGPLIDITPEQLKAYVVGHAMTPEWQTVIDRIDEGDLTWAMVVEAMQTPTKDHDIVNALASLATVPPASADRLVQLGVLTPARSMGLHDSWRPA